MTYCCLVLLVNLDCLIGLSGDQSAAAEVKRGGKYPSLTVQGSRLGNRLVFLKVVTRFPIPEMYRTIVSCGEHDSTKWSLVTITNQLIQAPHPG